MPVKMKNRKRPPVKLGKYGQELKIGSGYRFDLQTLQRLRRMSVKLGCSCGEVVMRAINSAVESVFPPEFSGGHGTIAFGLSMTATAHRAITERAMKARVKRETLIAWLISGKAHVLPRGKTAGAELTGIIIDDVV